MPKFAMFITTVYVLFFDQEVSVWKVIIQEWVYKCMVGNYTDNRTEAVGGVTVSTNNGWGLKNIHL